MTKKPAKALKPYVGTVGADEDVTIRQVFDRLENLDRDILATIFTDKNGTPIHGVLFIDGSRSDEARKMLDLLIAAPHRDGCGTDELKLPYVTDEQTEEPAEIDAATQRAIQAHCQGIKHCGEYGWCYYDTKNSKIFWTSSKKDREGNKFTDPDTIESGFMKTDGVEDVHILLEEAPDGHENMLQMWPK